MGSSYSAGNKICCTCGFWGGSRSFDDPYNKLMVRADSSQGKCQLKNCDMSAGSECHGWEKWQVLR
jgi:hypothetical protein